MSSTTKQVLAASVAAVIVVTAAAWWSAWDPEPVIEPTLADRLRTATIYMSHNGIGTDEIPLTNGRHEFKDGGVLALKDEPLEHDITGDDKPEMISLVTYTSPDDGIYTDWEAVHVWTINGTDLTPVPDPLIWNWTCARPDDRPMDVDTSTEFDDSGEYYDEIAGSYSRSNICGPGIEAFDGSTQFNASYVDGIPQQRDRLMGLLPVERCVAYKSTYTGTDDPYSDDDRFTRINPDDIEPRIHPDPEAPLAAVSDRSIVAIYIENGTPFGRQPITRNGWTLASLVMQDLSNPTVYKSAQCGWIPTPS